MTVAEQRPDAAMPPGLGVVLDHLHAGASRNGPPNERGAYVLIQAGHGVDQQFIQLPLLQGTARGPGPRDPRPVAAHCLREAIRNDHRGSLDT